MYSSSVQEKPLHLYCNCPVDHWDGWMPMHAFIRQLSELEARQAAPFALADFLKLLLRAAHDMSTADGFYWEGDISMGYHAGQDEDNLFVALRSGALPNTIDEVVIGWKQLNNGTTFFASSIPIAILAADTRDTEAPLL
jgi:hypothetical protein